METPEYWVMDEKNGGLLGVSWSWSEKERTEAGNLQGHADYQNLRARRTSRKWPGGGYTELVGVLG